MCKAVRTLSTKNHDFLKTKVNKVGKNRIKNKIDLYTDKNNLTNI